MGKHILAADDVAIIRDVYRYVLGGAGYDVTVAADGREAVRALEQRVPDLVLLDIEMPKLSGWEALTIIRGKPEWQDIPVVMISVLPEPSGTEKEAALGYDCYVSKKKTGADLLALVEEVLNGDSSRHPVVAGDN